MLLSMENISKSYYDNPVLQNIDFQLKRGEVHALVGLNGAGKSTLVNIIAGVFSQDNGCILFDGEPVHFKNPREALSKGIFTFYQAANFLSDLTVAENVFLEEFPRKKNGFIDYKTMYARAHTLFEDIAYPMDVSKKVSELNISQIYMMALVRAIKSNAKLFIMDEPMINLAREEKSRMIDFVKKVREQGKSIIYITHTLSEIFELCDCVTILRDGKRVAKCSTHEIDQNKLSYLISGNHALRLYPPKLPPKKEILLEMNNICVMSRLQNISLKLHAGEILGIAGLNGSGRSMLIKTIFGEFAYDSGKMLVHGTEVGLKNSNDALMHHFGYVGEDRFKQGLFMDMGVLENMSITTLDKIKRGIFLNLQQEQQEVIDQSIELSLEFDSLQQEIRFLSGGNQQKVLVGRSLLAHSDILLLDEPTKGIDIVSRSEIYVALNELAAMGKGIIVVSSDMDELAGLCNRALILNEGKLVAEVPEKELSCLNLWY